MLHGLGALSSMKCCFTANDFDNALLEIDATLREVGAPDATDKKRKLEGAFSLALRCLAETSNRNPDKQLAFLLADMLLKYASISIEDNYFAAKQMLLAALNMHLYSIGLLNNCVNIRQFHTLKDLKTESDNDIHLFDFMEHIAATTDPTTCVATALRSTFVQSYPERRLMSLAQTLHCLGNCYQNLDCRQAITPENEQLFANLFHTSEAIFLLIGSDESKKELADLYYESWPFMHQRLHPNDDEGACTLYEKALKYNSSKEMQAAVANKRFQILFSSGKEEEALKHIQKAITMAETLNDTEQNRFLLANLYFNFACAMLSPNHFDAVQAEIHLTRAARYASQCRAQGRDNITFAFYDMRIAEFKLAKGDLKDAKIATMRAIETLKKYPRSQHPHILKAEALLSVINNMMRIK